LIHQKLARKHKQHKQLHKVQIELTAKKELRDKDSDHWQMKYNALVKEKEELQAKMDEDIMNLNAQVCVLACLGI